MTAGPWHLTVNGETTIYDDRAAAQDAWAQAAVAGGATVSLIAQATLDAAARERAESARERADPQAADWSEPVRLARQLVRWWRAQEGPAPAVSDELLIAWLASGIVGACARFATPLRQAWTVEVSVLRRGGIGAPEIGAAHAPPEQAERIQLLRRALADPSQSDALDGAAGALLDGLHHYAGFPAEVGYLDRT